MSFRLDTPYYQIPGSQSEATFGVIMEMLLKTRLKLNLETSREQNDEDVNTYLAGLMVSYIDPKYLRAISVVLSQYDIDIYQAVAQAEDRYHAYWIYKVNADNLLLSLGVFGRLWQESRVELIRMKRYYTCASEYQRRMYGKTTAVAEIQTKLAGGTERYLAILAKARKDYLHLIDQNVKPEELAGFTQNLSQLEQELPAKEIQDKFLDAYSIWLKGSCEPDLRQKLLHLLQELKRLDPGFPADLFLAEIGEDRKP